MKNAKDEDSDENYEAQEEVKENKVKTTGNKVNHYKALGLDKTKNCAAHMIAQAVGVNIGK